MASFAERMGHRAVRTLIQTDSLDAETRTELWNLLNTTTRILHDAWMESDSTAEMSVAAAVWTWEFKKPADEEPPLKFIWGRVKKVILDGEWWECLDIIENILGYIKRYEDHATDHIHDVFVDAYNNRFESFLVGFRFIGGQITPISTTSEAEAIETALSATESIAGSRHALERALDLLADRTKPDYPNSIKESISAVEAVVKKITGEHTLGGGLGKLEAAGLTIHPALKSAWSKMYGYTSDGSGIRHGDIEAADADQALAKYMLVTCSAFASYLIEEGRKTGLLM